MLLCLPVNNYQLGFPVLFFFKMLLSGQAEKNIKHLCPTYKQLFACCWCNICSRPNIIRKVGLCGKLLKKENLQYDSLTLFSSLYLSLSPISCGEEKKCGFYIMPHDSCWTLISRSGWLNSKMVELNGLSHNPHFRPTWTDPTHIFKILDSTTSSFLMLTSDASILHEYNSFDSIESYSWFLQG